MTTSQLCPLCGHHNEAAAVTCRQCDAHLNQATVVAALSQRVTSLEQIVAELQGLGQTMAQPALTPAAAAAPTASPLRRPITPPRSAPAPQKPAFQLPDYLSQSEFWLNKIGIGLVLLAVAFLFKFSIDQGWLTPPVRVFAGLAVGTALLVFGFRTYKSRINLSRVLLGGGIGTYYITGFAAFQLLELVPYPVAFAFMCFVTLLAFALSLRQNEAMLSLIGAVGGLATPFLLYTGEGPLAGLMAYTIILLIGIAAIYAYKGWQLLLWVSTAGAWLIFIIGVSELPFDPADDRLDRWATQIAVLLGWLVVWGLPTARRLARQSILPNLAAPRFGFADRYIPDGLQDFFNGYLYLLPVSISLITVLLTWEMWSLDDVSAGVVALIGAGIYGLVTIWLALSQKDETLTYSHLLAGALLLALALGQFFAGDMMFLAWTLEAIALHLISRRLSSTLLSVAAHGFTAVIGLWLVVRLFEGEPAALAIFNAPALADLVFIITAFGLTLGNQPRPLKIIYRTAAHVLLLGWFARELSPLPVGQGLVSTAWGVYTVILLILALRLRSIHLRTIALTTLFVLVGKLLVIDLAEVAAIWRILLFFGFGGVFLVLSYFSRMLWKAPEEETPEPPVEEVVGPA